MLKNYENSTFQSRHAGLLRKLKNESGSAVVEFVALALPLFVPVIIFLSQFAGLSNDEFMVRTLARETVRHTFLATMIYQPRLTPEILCIPELASWG